MGSVERSRGPMEILVFVLIHSVMNWAEDLCGAGQVQGFLGAAVVVVLWGLSLICGTIYSCACPGASAAHTWRMPTIVTFDHQVFVQLRRVLVECARRCLCVWAGPVVSFVLGCVGSIFGGL